MKIYLVYANQYKSTGGNWYLDRIFKSKLNAKEYIKKQKKNYYCIEQEDLYE